MEIVENDEIWKNVHIPVLAENYQVSNLGRIRRIDVIRDDFYGKMYKNTYKYNNKLYRYKVLSLKTDKNLYFYVDMRRGNTRKTKVLHRLIAYAFLGPPTENNNIVNHKNGDKHDNRVENLEWTNLSENSKHSYKLGRLSIGKRVAKYNINGELLETYCSVEKASLENGYNTSYISMCCRGERPKAYGYLWKYLDISSDTEKEQIKIPEDAVIIPGFKKYLIDPRSNVYSNRKNVIIIKQCMIGTYKHVAIIDNSNKQVTVSVHRLVAITFVPNPHNKCFVIHKDGNRLNNNVDNLEWVTVSENNKHRFNNPNNNTYKRVQKIDIKTNDIIKEYDNLQEASKDVNVHYSNISRAANGLAKTSGGYKWKFI